MAGIPDKSIDLILTDMPYNSTDLHFDKEPIDLDSLWTHYRRIIKPSRAIVLFADFKLALKLVTSNSKEFRYEWVWEKTGASGFLSANKCPLRIVEYILVFSEKSPLYNPQKSQGKPYNRKRKRQPAKHYSACKKNDTENLDGSRYPTNILKFNNNNHNSLHPTQKPTDLLSYLITTYSNVGDTVLDNFAGSGSTAAAALTTDRNFICIEKDAGYVDIANKRIEDWHRQPRLFGAEGET